MITRKMISEARAAGAVKLEKSPNGDGIVCRIGDSWFYFGGAAAEEYTDPKQYEADMDSEEITNSICETLKEFRTEFPDEYLYYELFLNEKIIPPHRNEKRNWFSSIAESLPQVPGESVKMWSDGERILCRTEYAVDAIADLLEGLYREQDDSVVAVTGCYDPEEDRKSGETDKYTGWWYVEID